MSLTPSQIQIVKSTIPVLADHGFTITKTMYNNMINETPSLREVFNRSSQVTDRQPAALATTLHAYAANIDNLGALSSAVERICQKHASLLIQPDQYDIVGKYLIGAFQSVLGEALTPEILEAWTAAYVQIAGIMKNREKDLSDAIGDWKEWREFSIVEKVQESLDITSFYLSPVDKKPLPSFLPGQYISIRTEVPRLGYKQARQFSLSDAPNEKYYRITVKRENPSPSENGDGPEDFEDAREPHYVTSLLHDTKQVGDIIEVSPPKGEFHLTNPTAPTPIVLISAGVGITPLLSMLNASAAQKSTHSCPISWIRGARDLESHIFADHVQQIVKDNPAVHAKVFIKNPAAVGSGSQNGNGAVAHAYDFTGRLDLSKLSRGEDLFLSDKSTEYYVVGPKSFIADVRRGLLDLGVDDSRVKYEIFAQGDLD